jgi:large subunit ribosomal protein L17
MWHLKSKRKLNRTAAHRKAMLNNIVTELFKHGRIKTTEVKAKEMVKLVDKLVTLAKRGDLYARRQVLRYIKDKDVVKKLFDIIAPRFQTHQGGYTRIVKFGQRKGDGAPIAIIELVE